jgi:hypothetical protein
LPEGPSWADNLKEGERQNQEPETAQEVKMTKLAAAALILSFALAGPASTLLAAEGTADCKVESVEGKTVVLDCNGDAQILEVGSPVEVIPVKKKTSIEGC